MEQVKNSFDKSSLIKIVKGMGIAAGGAAALAVLDYLNLIEISNPTLAAIVAWGVPVLINAVKEWRKGA